MTRVSAAAAVLALGLAGANAQDTAAPAPGAGQPAWSFQQDGALKWGHAIVPAPVSACSGAAILAAQEREPQLEAQIANDISVFSCFLLVVRNDTPERIQCQMSAELPLAGRKKPLPIENGIVLDAEATRTAIELFALGKQPPRVAASSCYPIPQALPPFKDRKECKGEFRAPSPARFYPPLSRRNLEEGAVVIEYGVVKGSTRVKDVRVVGSSGFTGLDTAALKVAYESEATHRCADARYRTRIVFKLED
jgi:TonB family protein